METESGSGAKGIYIFEAVPFSRIIKTVFCPPFYASGFPLMPFHVDMSIVQKVNTLASEQFFLHVEGRCKPAAVIDHPMAGVVSVKGGVAQDLPDQAGIPFPANHLCDLAVADHLPRRDFTHDRKDLIGKIVVKDSVHILIIAFLQRNSQQKDMIHRPNLPYPVIQSWTVFLSCIESIICCLTAFFDRQNKKFF